MLAARHSLNAPARVARAMSTQGSDIKTFNYRPVQRKTTKLRNMFYGDDLSFLMEAHNGLSARIAEEAGFQGLWGSGLSISAALGVRDNNEASWTQVLEVLEFMTESTTVPILLDGDTGYGNFNNARRLIRKLESRGVAGVCLEDKLFPKQNSFLDGELQPLADINEFCGKIRACKETQSDDDFMVVARLESFITGYGLDDALKRAEAYHKAGADAILCHSKLADSSDIDDFMQHFGDRCPVVIVPTKYWKVPTQHFRDIGVSTIIWANHNLRTSVNAMQETSRKIFEDESLYSIESDANVVPVSEVFRLQNVAELKHAEGRYETLDTSAMTETARHFLDPEDFYEALGEHGTTFFTGVPDSLLKDICAYITTNTPANQHVLAANEGTAVATAAGHYLATGEIPCVYLQNSGLGNTVNPITSLCDPAVYSIPMLLVVGWRGEPGKKDEPQHALAGQITPALLREMGVAYSVLPDYNEGARAELETAYAYMKENSAPYVLLVKRQTFDACKMPKPSSPHPLRREEVLDMIVQAFPATPLVTTTGFTSREVFELREAQGHGHGHDFLTVGSMGHCSSITLGMALAKPEQDFICVDGDGAAIMHMGAMHTIARAQPANLKHIIVNNATHDSVGAQPTGADEIDFCNLASALGYKSAVSVSSEADVEAAIAALADREGPCLLEIKCRPGARSDLGRPTTTPTQNKFDFMHTLSS